LATATCDGSGLLLNFVREMLIADPTFVVEKEKRIYCRGGGAARNVEKRIYCVRQRKDTKKSIQS
jgi:hypothetical protein